MCRPVFTLWGHCVLNSTLLSLSPLCLCLHEQTHTAQFNIYYFQFKVVLDTLSHSKQGSLQGKDLFSYSSKHSQMSRIKMKKQSWIRVRPRCHHGRQTLVLMCMHSGTMCSSCVPSNSKPNPVNTKNSISNVLILESLEFLFLSACNLNISTYYDANCAVKIQKVL